MFQPAARLSETLTAHFGVLFHASVYGIETRATPDGLRRSANKESQILFRVRTRIDSAFVHVRSLINLQSYQ